MRHKTKESIRRNEIKDFSYKERFKVLLDLIEMIEMRERRMADQHKDFSCDRERFKGQERLANYLKDVGTGLYEGKAWAMDIYYKVLKSIDK